MAFPLSARVQTVLPAAHAVELRVQLKGFSRRLYLAQSSAGGGTGGVQGGLGECDEDIPVGVCRAGKGGSQRSPAPAALDRAHCCC